MKHFNLTMSGKVQQVGFRFSAMETACRFSISGFVMNMGYDRVYIEAEGLEENLRKYLAWCRQGPLGARVDHMEIAEAPLKNYANFEIVSRKSLQPNDLRPGEWA